MQPSAVPAGPVGDADDPPFPDDAIEVGRVIGAWGIKGWVRVQPYSADPKALFSSRRWFIQPPEATAASRARGQTTAAFYPPLLRITHSKTHGDGVVAAAREIADRPAAEAMKGARIFIARSSFPTAADGEYYWVDLVGLTVVNRQGELLGTVADLLDTGAHSVLRVAAAATPPAGSVAEAAAERLIPFVAAYVDDVDLVQRRIVVDWGLDY